MSAAGLLARAIEAHGGNERWEQLDQLVLDVRSGGFALLVKGRRRDVARYRAWVSTREPHAVFAPYPRPGQRGVFEPAEVRIESDDGRVLARRADPRSHFGLRRQLWWDRLDLLHFAGYAMWTYLCTPFLFAREGFEVRELGAWEEDGERWRRLAVSFPPSLPAHSSEQVFYFDEAGLLRRNDYTAEVFGSWAKAAHYCHDHRDFDGIVIPTRRRVYPRARSGRPQPGPLLVRIDVDSVDRVERGAA